MKVNRKGVTRVIIELDTVVIKIPKPWIWNHFLRGILANINERRTWEYNSGKYEKGISHLLCPVLWTSWGGWILVMRRAVPLSREDWDVVTISEHVKYFPGDDTLSNYGWLNARPVKFDYGELDIYPSGMAPVTSKN